MDGRPAPRAPRRRLPAVLSEERPRPRRVRERPGAWRLAVATVCFGAFMGQLDASVVTLTYRDLSAEFHASTAAVEWVSLAYLLTLVALLVPVGRLADAHGRKLFYLHGFALFTAASAGCGLAPSLPVLVGARVAQAAGAAMMQANSVALVTTSAPRGRLRAALGVQAAAQALGLALGPTIGGALVSAVGWRWVFAVNVPVGLVALVAGRYLLPRTRGRAPSGGFDPLGPVLLAASTTALLLGLSAASGLPFPGWSVAALLVTSAVAGRAFLARSRSRPRPLLDPALLRSRTVVAGLAGALCDYLVLFGPLVLVPAALTAEGASELVAGLVLTALPAGFALAATCAERVLPAGLSDRARCVLGALVCLAALAVTAVLPLTPFPLVPLLALLGLGLGVYTPANNATVMAALPTRSAGTGGGLINMARGLGTALGIALVTLTLHLAGGAGPRWAVVALLPFAGLALAAALGPAWKPAGRRG
ncbi:MFS transporter [Streptomyces mobaraensis NBRC 13819 = DSM 40847]|uniref:Major facilitator transporter n=1 Tax=Streptomyces mobaraensis (strain ATCC 29032 / DSM 40847 / JCM 4168 / NBRC 13819 / NCIMB 11159 / IPCR 16-22) TaxID=1223523 RepID=M3C867_STRM1|nr:MFS transporter [Streptomyces mobaraensis]EMF00166.1 major facilitator transporter [Streptomyces mobaraensis NBRC 13819 = DSM 40847]QTT72487.1 MFS transporter [Streptomyces mobaraensis NBRC 13819 = DSM 40847]